MRIDEILKKALLDADVCATCGVREEDDFFLCMNCGKWNCNECEGKFESICKPCERKKELKVIKSV